MKNGRNSHSSFADADITQEAAEALLRELGKGVVEVGRTHDEDAETVRRPSIPVVTAPNVDLPADQLRQAEARYRTLVEQIPAITFMASLQGGVSEIYVSPHIERMLGFSQSEWLGDPFLWYRQLHPDDRARWGEEFARTCATGVNFRSEYRFISRDGRVIWVHGEATVVRDEFGNPLFLQGIAFNITENKEAEAALRRSSEELEHLVRERTTELVQANLRANAASQARGSFLANVSHEIRTPLNAILGYADLLRRKIYKSEKEQDAWLQTIHDSGRHLLRLINDVLDLSKIDAGKLEIERIRFSPLAVVRDTCALLRPRAAAKGLSLEIRRGGSIPATIENDPTRLKQLLTNLIGNSIKFTAKGGIDVDIRHEATGRPRLVVAIIDSGIGIPEDRLGMIFEPFTQADASTSRKFGGTGLGLAICKNLSEAMGGGIAISSRMGEGTTITFEIDAGPLDAVALLEDFDDVEEIDLPLLQDDEEKKLPYRILVVDDGDSNRELVRLMLEFRGSDIECAENGRQAVDMATSKQYDLVLMDIQMPDMDGIEATIELRRRGVVVPIVALTANAMKGDDAVCLQNGFTGYVTKPIEEEALVAAILQALGQTPAELAAPSPAPLVRSPGEGPIRSSLPADPVFHRAIKMFVDRLQERLREMEAALANSNLQKIAEHAHWLLGAGGTAGFGAFSGPASKLEQAAKSGSTTDVALHLDEVRRLSSRIEL